MNSPPLPHNCILILPCYLSLRQTDGHKTSFLFCYIAKPRQKKKKIQTCSFPPKSNSETISEQDKGDRRQHVYITSLLWQAIDPLLQAQIHRPSPDTGLLLRRNLSLGTLYGL